MDALDEDGCNEEEVYASCDSETSVLSVEELLYAATLTNDNARKEAIYKKTIEM